MHDWELAEEHLGVFLRGEDDRGRGLLELLDPTGHSVLDVQVNYPIQIRLPSIPTAHFALE